MPPLVSQESNCAREECPLRELETETSRNRLSSSQAAAEECPLRELETETLQDGSHRRLKSEEECPLRELETETALPPLLLMCTALVEECPLRELETETRGFREQCRTVVLGGMSAQGIRD